MEVTYVLRRNTAIAILLGNLSFNAAEFSNPCIAPLVSDLAGFVVGLARHLQLKFRPDEALSLYEAAAQAGPLRTYFPFCLGLFLPLPSPFYRTSFWRDAGRGRFYEPVAPQVVTPRPHSNPRGLGE